MLERAFRQSTQGPWPGNQRAPSQIAPTNNCHTKDSNRSRNLLVLPDTSSCPSPALPYRNQDLTSISAPPLGSITATAITTPATSQPSRDIDFASRSIDFVIADMQF
jgi:hypothetical protein